MCCTTVTVRVIFPQNIITDATKELDHEMELGKRQSNHKQSWRRMRCLFSKPSDKSMSGVVNFAAAWFMQGREVCRDIEASCQMPYSNPITSRAGSTACALRLSSTRLVDAIGCANLKRLARYSQGYCASCILINIG